MNNFRVLNSDGIYFCLCENVMIINSFFVCGDDCVVLSGIINWEKFCENVIVLNCIM